MAHNVFISYASKDKAVADAICVALEDQEIQCWIAPRNVLAGIPYGEALIEALNLSRVMVLIFSSSSNNSQQVLREIERAASKGIPIVPFRIEDVPLSKAMQYFISSVHWLDALTPPLEKHLQNLGNNVNVLLSRPRPSDAAGPNAEFGGPQTAPEERLPSDVTKPLQLFRLIGDMLARWRGPRAVVINPAIG